MSKPRYGWWGYIKAVIRRYPSLMDAEVSGIALREKEAVQAAVDATERLENGKDRLMVVDLVFWSRTHTLEGAAMQVPCSYEAAKRYQQRFIKQVAMNMNLLDQT